MNSICRLISQRACPTKRLVVLHSCYATKSKAKPNNTQPSSSSSTTTTATTSAGAGESTSPKPPHSSSRPSEVPFQAKVSNSVHLIGYVHAPVQFETAADGSTWAATVITQNPSSSSSSSSHDSSDTLPLWVPTVFEGDLAHIAASHLKVNDHVYIAGKLSASLPHLSYNQFQASVQVMVHNLNFVDESFQAKKSSTFYEQEKGSLFIKEIEKGTLNNSDPVKKDGDSFLRFWMDLLENPKEWMDFRDDKLKGLVSKRYPDFKRKDGSRALWLDKAPKQVLEELSGLEFDVQIQNSKEVKQFKDSVKKDGDSASNSWNDLIDNPKQWWDYRISKFNGLVSPKYPDFKHKDGGHSLWLSSAPQWVSSKLEGLEFDVQIQKLKVNGGKGDELWKDLLENPNKWWDNRVDKIKERSPDFKHKETGEALWLSDSPTWVLSKLPPPKSKLDVAKGNS